MDEQTWSGLPFPRRGGGYSVLDLNGSGDRRLWFGSVGADALAGPTRPVPPGRPVKCRVRSRRVAVANGILFALALGAAVALPVPFHLPHTTAISFALLGGLMGFLGIRAFVLVRSGTLREAGVKAEPEIATPCDRTAQLLQVSRFESFFVHRDGEEVGIVDEIICDARGNPLAVIVSAAWFGHDRFLVPIENVRRVQLSDRRLVIDNCGEWTERGVHDGRDDQR